MDDETGIYREEVQAIIGGLADPREAYLAVSDKPGQDRGRRRTSPLAPPPFGDLLFASPARIRASYLRIRSPPCDPPGTRLRYETSKRKNGGKSMPVWAWVLIILLIVLLLGGFGYRRRR